LPTSKLSLKKLAFSEIPMENTSYTVVGLDGKEHENVNFETIKQWYSTRSLNENSLIFSPEIGKWQMLKRVFDLSDFQVENSSWQKPNTQKNTVNQGQTYTNQVFQPANPSTVTIIRQPKDASEMSVIRILAKVAGVVILLFSIGSGLVGVILKNRVGDFATINQRLTPKQEALLAEVKKHEIPEKHFVDQGTGVTVTLPNNWRRLNLQNPYFTSEDARLIGFDEMLNKGMMLEVTTAAEDIDRGKLVNQVVPLLESVLREQSTNYKTLVATGYPMKGLLATKITFERLPVKSPNPFNPDSEPKLTTGTMIVAVKNRNIYILQFWCGKDSFSAAAPEFTNIENSFSIP
jgi:hypothetical protein